MRISKAKELVLAKEQLPTLTPAELTEVSGGRGPGHGHGHKHEHKHGHHRHHRRHRHH
jgi:hypothetical protein